MLLGWLLVACGGTTPTAPDVAGAIDTPVVDIAPDAQVTGADLESAASELQAYTDEAVAGALGTLRGELAAAVSTLDDAIRALQDADTATDGSIADLNGRLEGVEADTQALTTDVDALSADVGAVDAAVTAVTLNVSDASRLTTGTVPDARLPLRERALNLNLVWSEQRTSFVLPPDFAGTSATVEFVWEINATNCESGFEPGQLTYARPGIALFETSSSTPYLTGGGPVAVGRTARMPVRQTFVVTAPPAFGAMQPGDAIHVLLDTLYYASCQVQPNDPMMVAAQLRYLGR